MNSNVVLTTCPYCGCGCNFFLEAIEGQLISLMPCPTDPVSEGQLCIKGRYADKFVHHPDRLTKPLIKKGKKFIEASWDEALTLVVEKLQNIKKSAGPDALAFVASARCTNEDNYVFQKLARAVFGSRNVDHCARLCHASTVAGLLLSFGSGAMTNSIAELEDADCIMVVGSNTMEQHPLIAKRIVAAREKGAKLIVIDPRKTPLVEFANIHLQLKPGTDIALINALMNVIISEGLVNQVFINERTEGFADVKKKAGQYSPAKVAGITGVSADAIIEAAKMYAGAKRASICYCMGITQHVNGTSTVRALANLPMMTGNIGRESTGLNPLRGQNNVQGSCDMGALPNVFPGYQRVDDDTARKKFEAAWGVPLDSRPGMTLTEMFDAAHAGQIKTMFIMGENPVLSEPNRKHAEEALKNLDFLVVQDIFMNETTEFADVILPAASYAEKEGTFTNTERKVSRVRQAIAPIGESKPDWQIISEIARKMGSDKFNYTSSAEIMDEIASLTPSYAGISFERLDNGEKLVWPCPDKTHPGTPILHKGQFTRGKGQFFAVDYQEPPELPDTDYPLILTTGRVIFQYHTGTMTRRTPLLEKECNEAFVEINPKDADKLSIKNGEKVSVKSRRGEIEVKAMVTDHINSGVVFVPFHFTEAAANSLTLDKYDPDCKIPEFKVCAVSVSKKG